MAKRVLLSGYYGFDNFGDDLILRAILGPLNAHGFEPIVLSEDPIKTSTLFEVEAIGRMNLAAIQAELKIASAFVSGGGGLFQDATGLASPVYYGGLVQLVRWSGVPVAFFGQGIGPLNSVLGRTMATQALKASSLIVVREGKSKTLAEWMVPEKQVHVMGDPVWLWQAGSRENLAETQAGIGVSLRPWKRLGDTDIQELAEILAEHPTAQTEGVNLIDCQAGQDIVPLAKLEKALRDRQIKSDWFAGQRTILGLSQSREVIAMRFHALLIAALLQKPCLAIAYDPKVHLLANSLGLVDWSASGFAKQLQEQTLASVLRHPIAAEVDAHKALAQDGFDRLTTWIHRMGRDF